MTTGRNDLAFIRLQLLLLRSADKTKVGGLAGVKRIQGFIADVSYLRNLSPSDISHILTWHISKALEYRRRKLSVGRELPNEEPTNQLPENWPTFGETKGNDGIKICAFECVDFILFGRLSPIKRNLKSWALVESAASDKKVRTKEFETPRGPIIITTSGRVEDIIELVGNLFVDLGIAELGMKGQRQLAKETATFQKTTGRAPNSSEISQMTKAIFCRGLDRDYRDWDHYQLPGAQKTSSAISSQSLC